MSGTIVLHIRYVNIFFIFYQRQYGLQSFISQICMHTHNADKDNSNNGSDGNKDENDNNSSAELFAAGVRFAPRVAPLIRLR